MDRETRLIIWNQFEILKALYPTDADDLTRKQDIVASGYTSRYGDLMPQIDPDEADQVMQKEVIDILQMYRALEDAKVAGWAPSESRYSSFQGFDGNNDNHYAFAGFLLNTEGLFSESAPNKNSHSSGTISIYRNMLARWDEIGRKYPLKPEEAEAIITR